MTDEEIKRAFNERVEQIIKAIYEVDEQSIINARAMLDETRLAIIGRVAEGGSATFDLTWLEQIKGNIEASIDRLDEKLNAALQSDFTKLYDLGVKLVDDPLLSAGVTNHLTGISSELAQVAADLKDNAADMVRGIMADARTQISGALRRAAFGAITPAQAIDQIGRSLDSAGAFRSITARATTVYRTESLRIQSIATQARQLAHAEEVKRAGWVMGKAWGATYDLRTRPDHAAADGQERAVDETFEVGGEQLLFPRDPRGSAKQVCNCRCFSRPTLARLAN